MENTLTQFNYQSVIDRFKAGIDNSKPVNESNYSEQYYNIVDMVTKNIKPVKINHIEKADKIIEAYLKFTGIKINSSPFNMISDYSKGADKKGNVMEVIGLPPIEFFINTESFYSTMFHEMGHSTGERLGREGMNSKYDGRPEGVPTNVRGEEEAIAETTAALMMSYCDSLSEDLLKHNVQYVYNWAIEAPQREGLPIADLTTVYNKAVEAANYIIEHAK